MKAIKIIKKRIFIESISLLFLLFCVVYSSVTIKKSSGSNIQDTNNFIAVVDDKEYNPELKVLSDGEGLSEDGITYAVTNNNKEDKSYSILINTSEIDSKIIDNIKISVDDIYIFNLNELEKKDNYYVLFSDTLKAGYTKRYIIKSWYKLNSEITNNIRVNYSFKLDTN